MSMSTGEFILEFIKIFLAAAAAVFTYYKFFREGSHKQQIEAGEIHSAERAFL